MHSPDAEAAFADYDPDSGRWAVVQDPDRNQMQRMIDSPHLCPAMPFATGGRSSDRVVTEAGDLYHACRYLGCNQVATDHDQFGRAVYDDALEFYRAVETLRQAVEAAGGEPHLARVRRLSTAVVALRDRTVAVLREAAAVGGAELVRDAFPTELADSAAEPAARTPTIPLGMPVFVLSADPGGTRPGGEVAAPAPCGSCR